MLVLGIQHAVGTSKKTGLPYDSFVLHGITRRLGTGEVVTEAPWISPAEFDRSGVKVGDLVMVDRSGSVLVRDSYGDAVQAVLDLL